MVMGPTHAASGATAGLVAALALPAQWGGATSTAAALLCGGVAAGAALLPDLDHHNSTATRSFGAVSQVVHHALRVTSVAVEHATGSGLDQTDDDAHRGFTHTFLFAALVGFGCYAAIGQWGSWATIAVVYPCLVLAVLGLAPGWSSRQPVGALAGPAAVCAGLYFLPGIGDATGVGVAVAVGLAAHCLGDMITKKGCPILAPVVPLAGRRWFDIRLPKLMRIKANGTANTVLLGAFSLATAAGVALAFPDIALSVRGSAPTLPAWMTSAAEWEAPRDMLPTVAGQ